MSEDNTTGLLQLLCEHLADQSSEPDLWARDDFNRGRLSMLHEMLLALDSDVKAFGIDKSKIGLNGFDVGEWYKLGPEYVWSSRA